MFTLIFLLKGIFSAISIFIQNENPIHFEICPCGNGCFEISNLLQITKEDALPKNICQRCVYKLDMFYEFRVSCMTTDTVLKNYADSLKHLAASVNQVSREIHGKKKRKGRQPLP